MSNDFFDTADYTALSRNTRALAEAVMAIAAAIEVGFDLLPSKLSLQQGKAHFVATDSGAANAYVVSMEKTPPAYSDGLMVAFRVATTNSGASTINVNSLGLKDIRNYAGSALTGGELVSGSIAWLWYDNTNGYFRILAPLVAVGSVSVTNNVKASTTDTTPGTLTEKLTEGPGVNLILNNAAGNENYHIAANRIGVTSMFLRG